MVFNGNEGLYLEPSVRNALKAAVVAYTHNHGESEEYYVNLMYLAVKGRDFRGNLPHEFSNFSAWDVRAYLSACQFRVKGGILRPRTITVKFPDEGTQIERRQWPSVTIRHGFFNPSLNRFEAVDFQRMMRSDVTLSAPLRYVRDTARTMQSRVFKEVPA
jgi:hypothetical protein